MHNLLEKLFGWSNPFFRKLELGETFSDYLSLAINTVLLCVVAYYIFQLFRYFLVRIMIIVARKSKTRFDDLLVSNKTAKYISHLIPLLFIYKSVPIILKDFVYWEGVFGKLVGIYIIILSLWIIKTIFNAIRDFLKQNSRYSDKPIDSYIQVIMIVLWIFGFFIIVSRIFDINTGKMIGAFGAISAIIILIFRDTILGFVASVQVSLNDMVRIGDWITFEKFGADGDVIEINLATVKVRNFDKTTTTIPTYSMISDSFRNWRGMTDSQGRRIKRHVLIKATSIRFLKDEELDNFKKIELVSDYISSKQIEINKYNTSNEIDKSILINGRNMTNFGLFRKYITQYLNQHPGLNKEMMLLCRQLQPTPQGIPLEVYAFSNDKRFVNYEYIMSDIFDHIFASISYFDLEIYELSSDKAV